MAKPTKTSEAVKMGVAMAGGTPIMFPAIAVCDGIAMGHVGMKYSLVTRDEPKMVAHDFTYPLGHIVTGSFWHNLNENSLHLTIADTGWGKAVWGKLYGSGIQCFSGNGAVFE